MKRYPVRHARPRKVSRSALDDIEVGVLGLLGQSTKAIRAETGYSPCQVAYRLRLFDIRRTDFRDGKSESFAIVRSIARAKIVSLFKSQG